MKVMPRVKQASIINSVFQSNLEVSGEISFEIDLAEVGKQENGFENKEFSQGRHPCECFY